MGLITFSKKPQKKYYSYLSDGHIYNITSVAPQTISDGGGYYGCYFECVPYCKDTNDNMHQLFERVDDRYIATTLMSYNSGNPYYYQADKTNVNSWTRFDDALYYTKSGNKSYHMPNSSRDLPQIVDTDGMIYYLDVLIKNGDTYTVNTKFTPMDDDGKAETSVTYGDLVLDIVKNQISIHNFVSNVNSNIPDYLKKNWSTIDYVAPDFSLYGELFIEKLNEAMTIEGKAITKQYERYSKGEYVSITNKIEGGKGIVTSEKKVKE